MAELLFIRPEEITATTVLGGNVDIDNYLFCVSKAQLTVIEPLLGTILYDKIIEDIDNDTLTGDYLILFNDFVKPITKHSALAQFLAKKYSDYSQMIIGRFNKWICKNMLPEYKTCQDEVNAVKDLSVSAGWKLDDNLHRKPWYLE
jgi:hypothetical protein